MIAIRALVTAITAHGPSAPAACARIDTLDSIPERSALRCAPGSFQRARRSRGGKRCRGSHCSCRRAEQPTCSRSRDSQAELNERLSCLGPICAWDGKSEQQWPLRHRRCRKRRPPMAMCGRRTALRCAALRCAAVEYPFTYSSGCFARSIRNGLDAKLSALRRRIPAA